MSLRFLKIVANTMFMVFMTIGLTHTSFAKAPPKRAKWSQPAKKAKKSSWYPKTKKHSPVKKAHKPTKKAASVSQKKQTSPTKAQKEPKKTSTKTTKNTVKKTPEKVLTVPTNIDETESREDRPTSPWLFLFIGFVLVCIGGMYFLNNRKKQLIAARLNFQEHSGHGIPESKIESLDFPQSEHDAPRTQTLFGQTTGLNEVAAPKSPTFFQKLGEKASKFMPSKPKHSLESSFVEPHSGKVSFPNEDTSIGSITAIGAVKTNSKTSRSEATDIASSGITNAPGQAPCTFERYVEIQTATQSWRAQELPLESKLHEVFGMSTGELIQCEFYWKQKISGDMKLKKKYEELETSFIAKYNVA